MLARIAAARGGWNAKQVAPFILHWAALRATPGIVLPPGLEDPFEPLEFCSKAKFPSEGQVGVRASVRMFYRGPQSEPTSVPDDTVYNTVTVYRGDGAEKYLDELRSAVEACPTGALKVEP